MIPSYRNNSTRRIPRVVELAGLLTVLSAALYLYRDAPLGFFVQDDFGWLEESRFTSPAEYIKIFFRFNPALAYRPLSQETFFWAGQKLFGMWPPGFHAASIALHLLNVLLLYLLLRQFAPWLPCLLGTLFFAVHNAHLRSLYWISAVPEPMALAFLLAAFLLFIRFDQQNDRRLYALSLLAMGLGMLSKESILSLPFVLAGYCLIFSRARIFWALPFFALTGMYAVARVTSRMVQASPYPLTFGREAWSNLVTYLSWAAGFSDALLKLKLKWNVEGSYPVVAAMFVLAVVALFLASRDRRMATFALLWFLFALQPVLYFSGHIYSYYLAPALAATALLIASGFDRWRGIRHWKHFLAALALACFSLWSSLANVRREGRWWNERSFIARQIVNKMPELDRQVPPGRIAFLFGFGPEEFGAMQNDAALKAYGFSPNRFILVGLDERTAGQVDILKQSGGLRDYFCFVYSKGGFENWTEEFRRKPEAFVAILPMEFLDKGSLDFVNRPEVRLEANVDGVTAGKDTLSFRVVGLDARAIDVLYTLDGRLMPAVVGWQLDENRATSVFVDSSTRRGWYHYRAIRDSYGLDPKRWISVDVGVLVN